MFSKCHQQVAHLWICALILSFFYFFIFLYTHTHNLPSLRLIQSRLPPSLNVFFIHFSFSLRNLCCCLYNFFYTLKKWIYVERILLRIMMKCKNEARETSRRKSFSFRLKILFLLNQRKNKDGEIRRKWEN